MDIKSLGNSILHFEFCEIRYVEIGNLPNNIPSIWSILMANFLPHIWYSFMVLYTLFIPFTDYRAYCILGDKHMTFKKCSKIASIPHLYIVLYDKFLKCFVNLIDVNNKYLCFIVYNGWAEGVQMVAELFSFVTKWKNAIKSISLVITVKYFINGPSTNVHTAHHCKCNKQK